MPNIKELKQKYNYYLKRYYDGCNYIEEHLEQIDKYLPSVQGFLSNINTILEEIMKHGNVTDKEILEGF